MAGIRSCTQENSVRKATISDENGTREVTLYQFAFVMENGLYTSVWAQNQSEAAKILRGDEPYYCY